MPGFVNIEQLQRQSTFGFITCTNHYESRSNKSQKPNIFNHRTKHQSEPRHSPEARRSRPIQHPKVLSAAYHPPAPHPVSCARYQQTANAILPHFRALQATTSSNGVSVLAPGSPYMPSSNARRASYLRIVYHLPPGPCAAKVACTSPRVL